MSLEVALLREPLAAVHADVRSLARVHAAMRLQVTELGEAAAAQVAAEVPLARVDLLVSFQVAQLSEALPAVGADPRHAGGVVPAHVPEAPETRVPLVCVGSGQVLSGLLKRRGLDDVTRDGHADGFGLLFYRRARVHGAPFLRGSAGGRIFRRSQPLGVAPFGWKHHHDFLLDGYGVWSAGMRR